MTFRNSYEDSRRAEAYARLEFPGTYHLAYRDIPAIINEHAKGNRALDFGCGAGRSTRFLQKLGFDVIGIDISEDMIRKANEIDPGGPYHLVREGEFHPRGKREYDLVLSAFTFDNIPTAEKKIKLFKEIRGLLKPGGVLISLVSSPEIYVNEWASFSTKDYPENKMARSGDVVRIIITAIGDHRPVEDIIWTHESYLEVYQKSGLRVNALYKPLATGEEPYQWVNETRIAPWVIYILAR